MKQSSAKIYDKEMAHVMSAKELFGVEKPIIALLHLRALPGDPAYNKAGGLNYIIDTGSCRAAGSAGRRRGRSAVCQRI